jgi:hypothetical protein
MAEPENEAAEAVQRLRVALDRIAALAHRARPAQGESVGTEVAARLDRLIAELRSALGAGEHGEASKPR